MNEIEASISAAILRNLRETPRQRPDTQQALLHFTNATEYMQHNRAARVAARAMAPSRQLRNLALPPSGSDEEEVDFATFQNSTPGEANNTKLTKKQQGFLFRNLINDHDDAIRLVALGIFDEFQFVLETFPNIGKSMINMYLFYAENYEDLSILVSTMHKYGITKDEENSTLTAMVESFLSLHGGEYAAAFYGKKADDLRNSLPDIAFNGHVIGYILERHPLTIVKALSRPEILDSRDVELLQRAIEASLKLIPRSQLIDEIAANYPNAAAAYTHMLKIGMFKSDVDEQLVSELKKNLSKLISTSKDRSTSSRYPYDREFVNDFIKMLILEKQLFPEHAQEIQAQIDEYRKALKKRLPLLDEIELFGENQISEKRIIKVLLGPDGPEKNWAISKYLEDPNISLDLFNALYSRECCEATRAIIRDRVTSIGMGFIVIDSLDHNIFKGDISIIDVIANPAHRFVGDAADRIAQITKNQIRQLNELAFTDDIFSNRAIDRARIVIAGFSAAVTFDLIERTHEVEDLIESFNLTQLGAISDNKVMGGLIEITGPDGVSLLPATVEVIGLPGLPR